MTRAPQYQFKVVLGSGPFDPREGEYITVWIEFTGLRGEGTSRYQDQAISFALEDLAKQLVGK